VQNTAQKSARRKIIFEMMHEPMIIKYIYIVSKQICISFTYSVVIDVFVMITFASIIDVLTLFSK